MPNQFPLSRYFLLGIAVLMLGAAIPDVDSLLQRARQLRQYRTVRTTERTVVINGIPFR
jgi:hypothetical protein